MRTFQSTLCRSCHSCWLNCGGGVSSSVSFLFELQFPQFNAPSIHAACPSNGRTEQTGSAPRRVHRGTTSSPPFPLFPLCSNCSSRSSTRRQSTQHIRATDEQKRTETAPRRAHRSTTSSPPFPQFPLCSNCSSRSSSRRQSTRHVRATDEQKEPKQLHAERIAAQQAVLRFLCFLCVQIAVPAVQRGVNPRSISERRTNRQSPISATPRPSRHNAQSSVSSVSSVFKLQFPQFNAASIHEA